MTKIRNESGFTLVELLIVVVIIGILGGIIFAVIQPARQQLRARQGVLQANAAKMCAALYACAATTTTATNCDDATELGVVVPTGTPLGSTYVIGTTDPISVTSTLGACIGTCDYDFANGEPGGLTWVGCII